MACRARLEGLCIGCHRDRKHSQIHGPEQLQAALAVGGLTQRWPMVGAGARPGARGGAGSELRASPGLSPQPLGWGLTSA